MGSYAEKWRQRREAEQDDLRSSMRDEAQRLVRLMVEKGFRFHKCYLWGSVVKDKPLAPWSDIDLVIKGLDPKAFFQLYSLILSNTTFSVDMKPYEDIDEFSKNKLEQAGVVIYEYK